MNADRLLAHYERIADAPDAVPRLRRFILDLAVRGKLVEQDPDDEPASMSLVGGKGYRTQKVRPLDVPGWLVAPVESLLQFRYGKGLKASERLDDGPVPVFGSNGIVGYCATPLTEVPSIIVGRKGSAGALNFCDGPSWTTDVAYFVEAPNYFDLRYLLIELQTLNLGMLAKGVKPGLSRTDIYDLPLSIPPLAEQFRIVATVNKLMVLCDQLDATRAERETTRDRLAAASLARLNAPDPDPVTFRDHTAFALENLTPLTARRNQIKALRQTILNLAVRGKLVEQDPKDEPASALLKYIGTAKRKQATGKSGRYIGTPREFPERAAPYKIAKSWVWTALGDITISRDRERVPVSKAERENRAKVYDYYGASGVIDKIDDFLFDKSLLLVGEDGANLINRTTPIAFIASGKYWVNNHAHVLDGISERYLRYLELCINATDLTPVVTGTAQPKMNQANMNNIPIALPPLAEQHRIVAKVDELMAICDRLEGRVATVDDTRCALLEALLQEALVPPADGPAAA